MPEHLHQPTTTLFTCIFCGKDSADVMGDHFLSCMSGGHKTLMHNKVVDVLAREGYRAHAMPHREPTISSSSNERADLSLRLPGAGRDAPLVTDVAITHFATASALQQGRIGANAAAIAYQNAVKDTKYKKLAESPLLLFRDMQFLPCVYDSLGAPAPDAQQFLNLLGRSIAQTTSTHRSVVIRELHQRISFTIAQCTARRIIAGVAAIDDMLDRQILQRNAAHTHRDALLFEEQRDPVHSGSSELEVLAPSPSIVQEGVEGQAGRAGGLAAGSDGGDGSSR